MANNMDSITSVITLNINGLIITVKRLGLSEWVKIQYSTMCLQEIYLKYKEKDVNPNEKKGKVAILISHKQIRARKIIRNEEGHYIMINGHFSKKP